MDGRSRLAREYFRQPRPEQEGERFGLSKEEIPVRGNKNGRYFTTQYIMGKVDARGRAAVAAYYSDDPNRWLVDMRHFLSDKISEANLRTVMRQTTALAMGEGVAHTIQVDNRGNPIRFRLDEPISIGEDLEVARVAANTWLLPQDDPGHGWRLDLPIGKMAMFRKRCHLTMPNHTRPLARLTTPDTLLDLLSSPIC